MNNEEITKLARSLMHQAPWRVGLGWGSFLTFEFGTPIAEGGATHGEWHLWLRMCNWRIETSTEIICCSGDDPGHIRSRIDNCSWGSVQQVVVREPSLDLNIAFGSGHTVRTFISSSTEDDQWMLFAPDKMVFTAHGGGRCDLLPQ
jgi:hypothetical protein